MDKDMYNLNQSHLVINLACIECTKTSGPKLFPLASSFLVSNFQK